MTPLYFLDLAGTFVFAVSGIRAAADKRMDLFGALFLGFITALGGGTLRDMLLGIRPVSWLHDLNYLWTIFAALLFTYTFDHTTERLKKTLFLFDTIGLGVFTVIGVEKALALNIAEPYAVAMGMVSSVVGGITRDTFCGEIPLIFRKEIYATACLLGGTTLILLNDSLNITGMPSYGIVILFVIAIRVVAIKFKLRLPTVTPNAYKNKS
ncbi:membrane protein [Fulvitalea axinellae]|uniref:Membrane protein n=1 Tax=Fulvitalea axinellae TaxID=1182444 RepID=A0AAU9CZB8_9BACT|nr:membrane protein [Fulvitalea axinellae]